MEARTERETESRLVSDQRHDLETLTGTICPLPQDTSKQLVFSVQDKDRDKSYLMMECANGEKVYIPLGKPIVENRFKRFGLTLPAMLGLLLLSLVIILFRQKEEIGLNI